MVHLSISTKVGLGILPQEVLVHLKGEITALTQV